MVSTHLDAESIARMVEGALPASEMAAAEEHIADCAACQAVSTTWFELEALLHTWKSEGMRSRLDPVATVRALWELEDRTTSASVRARIRRWRERAGRVAAGDLSLTVGPRTSECAFRIPTDTDEATLAFRSVAATADASSQTSPPRATAHHPNGARVVVALEGDVPTLVVRIEQWPANAHPPLMLVRHGVGAVSLQEFQTEVAGLVVRLPDLPLGELYLQFEPSDTLLSPAAEANRMTARPDHDRGELS